MNPRVWAFDLELNQPSGKIIQVGGVIGDLTKGRILHTFNYYVNPYEIIHPFIVGLTGITQDKVNSATHLDVVKQELDALLTKWHVCKSPIVWGNGDLRALKTQGGTEHFKGTHREIDIKTIHQFRSISNGQSMRGGLAKSMTEYGMTFKGREHDALDDAMNTFLLALKFRDLLKKVTQ